ncbi:MAG TPA: hypothetical protein VE291_02930 [Terracidiphilus sp.]|jgi:energy-converting hydrogenase Eha subunit A|nr:hypothetical protein [Terracidiphilus sp.]
MGILFVLIFYAIALSIAAAIGSAILAAIAWRLTRNAPSQRRRAIIVSAIFPFACVAFAGVWFICYAVINYTVFHRDPGLGDGWDTPLPNGYALMMIDTTDQGTVYNPKTQGGWDSVGSQNDTEFGVRQLQVSGNRIFGARDSGYFARIGQDSTAVDTYFEVNTDTGVSVEFKTLGELRQHSAAEGATLNLREFQSVFSDYRTTWFDYLAGSILFLVPAVSFLFLARSVWRIRQQGHFPQTATNPALPQ